MKLTEKQNDLVCRIQAIIYSGSQMTNFPVDHDQAREKSIIVCKAANFKSIKAAKAYIMAQGRKFW